MQFWIFQKIEILDTIWDFLTVCNTKIWKVSALFENGPSFQTMFCTIFALVFKVTIRLVSDVHQVWKSLNDRLDLKTWIFLDSLHASQLAHQNLLNQNNWRKKQWYRMTIHKRFLLFKREDSRAAWVASSALCLNGKTQKMETIRKMTWVTHCVKSQIFVQKLNFDENLANHLIWIFLEF